MQIVIGDYVTRIYDSSVYKVTHEDGRGPLVLIRNVDRIANLYSDLPTHPRDLTKIAAPQYSIDQEVTSTNGRQGTIIRTCYSSADRAIYYIISYRALEIPILEENLVPSCKPHRRI